ncbi:MAG: hypothetical protein K2M90_04230, partial [Treponemataceae bacterium]|nr:hypothetical protein [Treponemataceae bacterium]
MRLPSALRSGRAAAASKSTPYFSEIYAVLFKKYGVFLKIYGVLFLKHAVFFFVLRRAHVNLPREPKRALC